MAGGVTDALVGFTGLCWRAVAAGQDARVLHGTVKAGRYNRPGERTLYMSSSPAGVAAAMARYGDAERALVRLMVAVDRRLVDLRDLVACAHLSIDPARVKEDWIAALNRGEEPASWAAADQARTIGAMGLIDASRRAPGEWHLVLFGWHEGAGARVTVAGPSRD